MTLDLSRPRVMAILNVTPDSFFAGSRMSCAEAVEARIREAVAEGCDLLDVGGYSSTFRSRSTPSAARWPPVR